jgi:hypothetical protein
VQGNNRLYAVGMISEIDSVQLTYFALSVFWRAAVTDWIIVGGQINRLELEESQMTALRAFLLDAASVPANMALILQVCDNPTLAATTLATPSRHADGFIFIVPGLAFHLFIGNAITPAMRQASLCGPSKGVVLRSNYEEFVKNAFYAKMQTAKPSPALIAFAADPKPSGETP